MSSLQSVADEAHLLLQVGNNSASVTSRVNAGAAGSKEYALAASSTGKGRAGIQGRCIKGMQHQPLAKLASRQPRQAQLAKIVLGQKHMHYQQARLAMLVQGWDESIRN